MPIFKHYRKLLHPILYFQHDSLVQQVEQVLVLTLSLWLFFLCSGEEKLSCV